MSTQPAEHDGTPVGPALGDVRFDSVGHLETFDGTDWVPLERMSDVEIPPIFRLGQVAKPSTREQADDTDPPASS